MVIPALYENVLKDLTIFVAICILISGLDDAFIDLYYYVSECSRKLNPEKYKPVSEKELSELPEQPIAVMIPAWHEHAVIAHMLRNTLSSVDYHNFEVFVGTYPNDEATLLAVAEVAEENPRVHRIVCPHDGPTNKADCLNWIIEGIRVYDKNSANPIKIFMLHDSEDMVHPLSFKLMNYHIPRVPMVQIPVVPLETPISEITAGTYLDEFAESHIKDMVVRERISGMVPSAGVGTGFSRDAIEKLATKHNNQIFNIATFTEDYDLAFRLKEIGEGSILLQYFVERTKVVQAGWLKKREKLKVFRELVATREYFPSKFSDAVRQKARWTLGIVFHGWQQRGWEGNLSLRYMIWRDRKTLMTNSVNMLGYLLLLEAAIREHLGYRWSSDVFSIRDSWIWKVILADTALLVNRCVQRVVSIGRVSSWRQAVLSVPRIIWGNLINFFAVAKAANLFLRTTFTGKKLVWAKTAHAFPSEGQLLNYKRKLGDLLLENRLLSLANLNQALKTQKESGGRLLGDILVDLGFVQEKELTKVLGRQLKVDSRHLGFNELDPEGLDLISEEACREHLMVVVNSKENPMVIAAADVLDARMRKWLDANLGAPYRLVLAGRRNIVEIIDHRSEIKKSQGPFRFEEIRPFTSERLQ